MLQALQAFNVLVLAQTLNILATIAAFGVLARIGFWNVTTALVVGAIAALIAALVGFLLLPRDWRRGLLMRGRVNRSDVRQLLGFSKWLWLGTGMVILYFQLDLLLVNRMSDALATGHYALAYNLSMRANVLVQSANMVLLPAASVLVTAADVRAYLRRSWRQVGLMTGLLAAALVFADPFIRIVYGARFEAALVPFLILGLVVGLDVITMPVDLLAYPFDIPRLIALSNGLRLVLLLALAPLLIVEMGIAGAAVAKLVAKIVSSLLVFLITRQRFRKLKST